MANKTINELDALRIVKACRKHSIGGRRDFTVEHLRRALGADLSDAYLSNLLNDKQRIDENRVLRLISGTSPEQMATRQRVEAVLGLDGLFSCASRQDVIQLVERTDGISPPTPRITFCDGPSDKSFGLTEPEKTTIRDLSLKLTVADQSTFYWNTPFNSGASTVVMNLWPELHEAGSCSSISVLRPSDLERPFDVELNALSIYLESRKHRVGSSRLLADAIKKEKILVAVLSPYSLDALPSNNALRSLTKEFLDRNDNWTGICNLLFVGKSEWLDTLKIREADVQSAKLKSRLRSSGEDRFKEFRSQWERFSGLREQLFPEESGSRMRRAATYFRVQNTTDAWPISVKLRALFASNGNTASYFDPTQGFRRIAGQQFEEFEDIRMFHEDVKDYLAYLRHIDTGSHVTRVKKTYYYLLQYNSTAKYWLTQDALETLIDKIEGERPNALNISTEKKRMLDLSPVVTEKKDDISGEKKSKYIVSLAVKAIVQDDWMDAEAFTRSLAHYRIAKRLKDNENDKQLLNSEFPYEPHWGRSRMYFLAETVRHLVRSCETYSGEMNLNNISRVLEFPPPPSRHNKGTDPSVVINYCYEVLYQKGLNNNTNGINGRALTKRYGAYQLAVELLELLSENYEIGQPHPALAPEKRAEFMRQCGYALLDIGELHKARVCFENAQQEIQNSGREIELLDVMLDLTLVDAALGNIASGGELLGRVRTQVELLHRAIFEDTEARDSLLPIRKLFRRLLSREAHLAFLNGENERALDLIDQMQNKDRWAHAWQHENARGGYRRSILVPSFSQRLETEQTHVLLAALHQRARGEAIEAETSDFDAALDICLDAMLVAQSEGNHHQAMGFRIALSRCFRRMNRLSAAETILDSVHFDLLRYGCSERTFLAFLNEAGRVLAARGDPIRAYATYLRPAIGRANARGFSREAEQAATLSVQALEKVQQLFAECSLNTYPGGEKWQDRISMAVDQHRKLISESESIFRGGAFEKDPLFAYAIADAEKIIGELHTSKNIDQHLHDIQNLLRKNRGSHEIN